MLEKEKPKEVEEEEEGKVEVCDGGMQERRDPGMNERSERYSIKECRREGSRDNGHHGGSKEEG